MPSRRRYLATLLCGALAGCTTSRAPVDSDWPRTGYDDQNTGYAADHVGPVPAESAVRWRHEFSGDYLTSPVVADGTVYVAYADGSDADFIVIAAFDPATGKQRWQGDVRHVVPDEGIPLRDSLVYEDRIFYVVSVDGLQPQLLHEGHLGGSPWELSTGHDRDNTVAPPTHPVVADGTVYFATAGTGRGVGETGTEAVYAVDTETGAEQWTRRFDAAGGSGWPLSPAFDDGVLFVPAMEHGLLALDAASGETVWTADVRAWGPPSVAGSRLFVYEETPGDGGDRIVAVDVETGEVLWRKLNGGGRLGQHVTTDGELVYHREMRGNPSGVLVARDVATGAERWRSTGPAYPGDGAPAVVDDVVYVAGAVPADGDGDRATLFALDRETGERRGGVVFDEGGALTSSPVVVDGMAFATGRRHLWAVDTCAFDAAGRCLVF